MIIESIDQKQDIIKLREPTTEPDPNWLYQRSDGFAISWRKDGDHWHIPGLVKKFRVSSFNVDTNEHEHEEYYIDPITDEEVKPGYISREKFHHIPGFKHTKCKAFLTKDEIEWLRPPDNLKELKKKTVLVNVDTGIFRLTGVFVASATGEERDGVILCTLSVDKMEVIKGITPSNQPPKET